MAKSAPPKLFISYSQSVPEHVEWVRNLATTLRKTGIDVILDKWDLKEGDDAVVFMEKMVSDSKIKKVLIVSGKSYSEKANKRSNGVGTETQIISAEIYKKQKQNKFVVAVVESDETGKPYLPTYYKSRIYIDFRENKNYSEEFEKLIRWVFDKPLNVKPEIGNPPSFIDDENAISLGTTVKFKMVVDAIKKGDNSASGAIDEYLNTFTKNLERFRIQSDRSDENFDDKIIESIGKFMPYRDELIKLFIIISQYSPTEENTKKIHRFFERIIPYAYVPKQWPSHQWDMDNIRFIIHELFLYTIAVFIKNENFSNANYLLEKQYYFKHPHENNVMHSFTKLCAYMESLEYRNRKQGQKRISIRADLLKERCVGLVVEFEDLMQTDFTLFLRSNLDIATSAEPTIMHPIPWWPETLAFTDFTATPFEIFARSISKEYFDQVKVLLAINDKQDFGKLWLLYNEKRLTIPKFSIHNLPIASLLNYEKLATNP